MTHSGQPAIPCMVTDLIHDLNVQDTATATATPPPHPLPPPPTPIHPHHPGPARRSVTRATHILRCTPQNTTQSARQNQLASLKPTSTFCHPDACLHCELRHVWCVILQRNPFFPPSFFSSHESVYLPISTIL